MLSAAMAQSGHSSGHSAARFPKEQKTVKTNTQIDQPTSEGKLPADTVAMLAPLFTWRGKAVYPVFGAEGEGEGGTDPDSEPEGDEDDDAGKGAEDKGSETVSRDEFDQLKRQLQAADKNRSAAEKKLKEIEDGKKDEYTKATERVSELEKVTAKQAEELAEQRLQNAFLTANTGITWHDPADALDVAERRGYLAEVVNDEGKVDTGKLADALKKLAKAKPHLVKDGSTTTGNTSKGKDKPTGPTGSKVGGTGKNTKDEPNLSRYDRLLNR